MKTMMRDFALAMVATNYCRQFAMAHGRQYDLLKISCGASGGKCPFKKMEKKCSHIQVSDWMELFKQDDE